jgi:BAI1-associated protein 3
MPDHVVCEESMLTFLQNAFKIPFKTHVNLFKAAKARAVPTLKLNVEIIKAKNLSPKDSNGLADPFVTLFLASDPSPTGSYETEWKPETLEPVWKEKCEL